MLLLCYAALEMMMAHNFYWRTDNLCIINLGDTLALLRQGVVRYVWIMMAQQTWHSQHSISLAAIQVMLSCSQLVQRDSLAQTTLLIAIHELRRIGLG